MENRIYNSCKIVLIPWFCCSCQMIAAQSNIQIKLSNQIRWTVTDTGKIITTRSNPSPRFNKQLGYSMSVIGNASLGGVKRLNTMIVQPKLTGTWGLFIETDPGELLNKPDFLRAFLKFKPSNKNGIINQLILGSYQIQLGEGLTKSNAAGFWSSNRLWASKLTDWQLAEKRGFHEGRNPQGAATEFQLRTWQALAAAAISLNDATTQYYQIYVPKPTLFLPDTLGKFFSSINLSGQHLDSTSLNKKHNLREFQFTLALKKQKLFLDTNTPLFRAYSLGLASHLYQFSTPYAWEKPSPNNTFSSLSNQFLYLESFASVYLNQGDMLYLHFTVQKPLFNRSTISPNFLFRNFSAYTAGYSIPIGKDNDFSIRYYRIAPLYFAFDGLNNHILRSTENITVTVKNTLARWISLQTILPLFQKLQYQPVSNQPSWIFQPELRTTLHVSKTQLNIALKTVISPYQEIDPLWQIQQLVNNNYPNLESYLVNNPSLPNNFTELYPKNGDLKFQLQWQQPVKKNTLQISLQGIQSNFFSSQFSAIPIPKTNFATPLNQSIYSISYIKKPSIKNNPTLELGLQIFDSNNGLLVGGCQILNANTPQFAKGNGVALHYAVKSKFNRKNEFGVHFQLVFQQVSITPVSGRIFVTLWQL